MYIKKVRVWLHHDGDIDSLEGSCADAYRHGIDHPEGCRADA